MTGETEVSTVILLVLILPLSFLFIAEVATARDKKKKADRVRAEFEERLGEGQRTD